eukprot:TRINITY_DN3196_c0_g1_i2.p1 TRINITY_DN3196_c0_g1~~TRINITY_DN3196_c0_g1_i2.p1  ORF type:complete len:671 (-),score=99.89 TRINITY_DN3196_c0_g1_i2:125-2137(-)
MSLFTPPALVSFQQDETAITNQLEHGSSFDLIVQPNVNYEGNNNLNRDEELALLIMRIVNTRDPPVFRSFLGNIVVPPGKVGLVLNNGQIFVIKRGRYFLSTRTTFERVYSLSENVIRHHSLSIIRVPKGQYALAMQEGRPLILGEGIHVRNSLLFQHTAFVDANQKHLQHLTINIIRVPSDEYCLITNNNVPKILVSGQYIIDSNFFQLVKFEKTNTSYIRHQTIHLVRVPQDKLALVTYNNKPLFLPFGNYVFNTDIFRFHQIKDFQEPKIEFESITRFRVRKGEVATVQEQGRFLYIEKPDIYFIDSFNFRYFYPEFYSRQSNWSFLSTLQVVGLVDSDSKNPLLKFYTKDFVEVGIKASVYYKVLDSYQTYRLAGTLGTTSSLIAKHCISTLQNIMRSTPLRQVVQNKAHSISSESPVFFNNVHDLFMSNQNDTLKKTLGVEVAHLCIYYFQIMDQELSNNLSKNAIVTAESETKLANMEGQNKIATSEMERDAIVNRIKNQSHAFRLGVETEAKNKAILLDAQTKAEAKKITARGKAQSVEIISNARSNAQAEAVRRIAEGQAQALLLKAEAESKAIQIRAAAEKKRAQDLSDNELSKKLSFMQVQSEMMDSVLSNIPKVIYLSSETNLIQSTLQFFTNTTNSLGLNNITPNIDNNYSNYGPAYN